MQEFLIKFGKAAFASFAVIAVSDALGPKLPEFLIVKGKDTRPYVVGAAVLVGLMMLPSSLKPVSAPPA